MIEFLGELGLKPGPDLGEWIQLAKAVQEFRRKSSAVSTKQVTRGTALYAVCELNNDVLELLQKAGLDWVGYVESIGIFPGDKQFSSSVSDVDLHKNLKETFRKSSENNPNIKTVSAAVIALFIIDDIANGNDTGKGPRRLKSLGLDPLSARDSLLKLIDSKVVHFESAKEETEVEHDYISISQLKRFEFSYPLEEFLASMEELGLGIRAKFSPGAALTHSMIFQGLINLKSETFNDTALKFFQGLVAAGNQKKGDDALSRYIEYYRDENLPEHATNEPVGWMTPPFKAVLDRAANIASETSGESRIHARHFVGAYLDSMRGDPEQSPGGYFLVRGFDLEVERMVVEYLAWLEQNAPEEGADDLDTWQKILGSEAETGLEEELVFAMPRFQSEGLGGEDKLKITPDVRAFAMLIASDELQPPLSVGVFGDWGSGKSFFMQKLQERINYLALHAKRRSILGENSAFKGNVVQIWFNAWHYVESNLWASLVTHIFEELNKRFTEEEKQSWENLLKKLDDAKQLRDDAEKQLVKAEEDLDDAQERNEQAELALDKAVEAVWTGLKDNKSVKNVEEFLAFDELRELKDDLVLQKLEAKRLAARIPLFRRGLLKGMGRLQSLGWGAVTAVIVVALVIFIFGFLSNSQFAGSASRIVDSVSTTIAQVLAILGAISGWLGNSMRTANKVMDDLEETQKQVLDSLEEAHKSQAIRDAKRKLTLVQDEVQERREEVAEVRAEVKKLHPRNLLANFLKDRASSSDYRKHLGLPAQIRRDFMVLQGLMQDQVSSPIKLHGQASAAAVNALNVLSASANGAEQGEAPDNERQNAVDALSKNISGITLDSKVVALDDSWKLTDRETLRSVMFTGDNDELECLTRWDVPTIDRIVLYIDDLDRCPPNRVVDVLQAVHLLLAFPLFVVVVGVDARWLERSLKHQYETQWRRGDEDSDGAVSGYVASPQDYLEKIFQVPFWLGNMDDDATRVYLNALVGETLSRASATPIEPEKMPFETVQPADHKGEDVDITIGEDMPGTTTDPDVQAAQVQLNSNEEEDEDPGEQVMSPLLLKLNEDELIYMEKLASIIGRSPRAVNRFVNVYRILRAQYSNKQARARFLGKNGGDPRYKAVQFLLAVLVGTPTVSHHVFEHISHKTDEDLASFFENSKNTTNFLPEASHEWDLLGQFAESNPFEVQDPKFRELLEHYVERVGRFSFRVGRVSQQPRR